MKKKSHKLRWTLIILAILYIFGGIVASLYLLGCGWGGCDESFNNFLYILFFPIIKIFELILSVTGGAM